MARIAHLPGIDGLRAVAVLAVVAYHAGAPMPSGFVGVDIFFVISGYLITRLLHDEVTATGRIDFLGFYARRARRILPAMVLVIVATLLAVRLLLPMTAQQETAKAAASALLFAGNVFFYVASGGYFELDTESSPLLHLWSLGVEEQFYLLWPVVLVLARRRPVMALLIIAVVSLVLAELWIPRDPNGAFYLVPTRAWELAAGGLVALRPWRVPRSAAWGALAIVLASLWYAPPNFPGLGALPAVAGTALLIAAIQGGHRIAALEWKPVVGIGLISYSLYLWHWPVLVIGRTVLGEDVGTAWLVAIAFALSVLTYRFVETPFRRRLLPRPRTAVVTATAAIVVGVAGSLAVANTAKDQPWALAPSLRAHGCDSWISNADVKPCAFGAEDAPRTAVLIGDSVGMQWFPAVYRIFQAPEWRIVVLTKSSCPMVDRPIVYKAVGGRYLVCEQWRKDALASIPALRPDVVVVGSTDTYAFTEEEWIEGTRSVLRQLSPVAGAVRVLGATPHKSGIPERSRQVQGWIEKAAGGFDNVSVVSMADAICPGGACPAERNGKRVFLDDMHLRAEFVLTQVPELRALLSGRVAGRPEVGDLSPGERPSGP